MQQIKFVNITNYWGYVYKFQNISYECDNL